MSFSLASCLSRPVAVMGVALLPWLAGCASVAPRSAEVVPTVAQHAEEDTEARAKRVFVYQSRIADALLDRYPLREDFASAEPELLRAEGRMTEACGPLTRAVVRHLEGRKQSVKHKLKVARSLDGCESAAQRVEALMAPPPSTGLVATGGP
jgi:hypothetical protein